jgi:signal transduction histidine kinase
MIVVTDTGIGIPVEALPHIFDRFFRVDQARSRSPDGAGLGLAIVRSICHAHGGEVTAESVLGKGSRFCVSLPLMASGPRNSA